MSIRGVGVDIVETARVFRLYERYGARFLARAFHPRERAAAAALPPAALPGFLSSRWAAKEALHKALGSQRLLFPDVEVARSSGGGPPALVLHNAALRYQREQRLALHLSLSHERASSVAFVVASTAPEAE